MRFGRDADPWQACVIVVGSCRSQTLVCGAFSIPRTVRPGLFRMVDRLEYRGGPQTRSARRCRCPEQGVLPVVPLRRTSAGLSRDCEAAASPAYSIAS